VCLGVRSGAALPWKAVKTLLTPKDPVVCVFLQASECMISLIV
jgi:hypothetical protein